MFTFAAFSKIARAFSFSPLTRSHLTDSGTNLDLKPFSHITFICKLFHTPPFYILEYLQAHFVNLLSLIVSCEDDDDDDEEEDAW